MRPSSTTSEKKKIVTMDSMDSMAEFGGTRPGKHTIDSY